jgi:general secretion pathway protein D
MRPFAHRTFAHPVCALLFAASLAAQQQPQTPAPAPNAAGPDQSGSSQAALATAAQSAPATAQTLPDHTETASGASAKSAVGPAVTPSARRRAAKLFLDGAKLFVAGRFEAALANYKKAAALDPENRDYPLAVEVARSHAVVALVQASAKERNLGNEPEARARLAHALELDPKNASVAEHIRQLAGDGLAEYTPWNSAQPAYTLAAPDELNPDPGTHSFHLRIASQLLAQQVYQAYGIAAVPDASLRGTTVRFDLDDATFAEAANALALVTDSFSVPLEPRRALIVRNTQQMRTQYQRGALETVSLTGLSPNEMHDIQAVTKNVFEIQKENLDENGGVLTLEASPATLRAFNNTWSDLSEGRPEILLEIRIYSLAHSMTRNTGLQLPQQMGVFNVLGEAQSVLSANQSLVQQIISSGLVSPNDIGAILAILLASGQVTNPLLTNGFALFGGACTLASGTCSPTAFGLAPGTASFSLNVNSSDSRELDDYQLRLEDGEEGTLKSGMRYPIMTSSYSSQLSGSSLNIPGLNTSGTSGALSGLLASLSSVPAIPMVQYQDLGLTLKARPRVMRSGDVSLSIDMKIDSLVGTSLNGIPLLASRVYTGVATMRANDAVVVAGEMDSTEIRAVSGAPGLSEIPGLDNATTKDTQQSSSTLLIVITPRVIRNPHGAGHSPMQILEHSAQAQSAR